MKIAIYNNNKIWYYKVKLSDESLSVEEFVKRFNFSLDKFKELNYNLSSLKSGDILKMPESEQYYHVAMPLETYESIARKYNCDENELKNINLSKNLFIGQKIFIWFYKSLWYTCYHTNEVLKLW